MNKQRFTAVAGRPISQAPQEEAGDCTGDGLPPLRWPWGRRASDIDVDKVIWWICMALAGIAIAFAV